MMNNNNKTKNRMNKNIGSSSSSGATKCNGNGSYSDDSQESGEPTSGFRSSDSSTSKSFSFKRHSFKLLPSFRLKMNSNTSVKELFNRFLTVHVTKSELRRRFSWNNYSNTSTSNHSNVSNEERIEEWKRYFESRVPGVIGIRNHGNTCFMNAILQCLSYTEVLAEYFVLDVYKLDLKRKKRIQNFRKFKKNDGVGFRKGFEVTETLATLFKSLWSLRYEPEISVKFKAAIDKYGSQYKGGTQQDAQEFLLWLLDTVHEDLNMASKRKYKGKERSGTSERTDEDLASETLRNYMRCNSSFVLEVFQAQFRSSLTCPTCERESNTFDPFLCVSLPIPSPIKLIPTFVIVVYADQSPRQVKLGLLRPENECIRSLKETLSIDTSIDVGSLLLTDLSVSLTHTDEEFYHSSNHHSVGTPPPPTTLYAFEIPKIKFEPEEIMIALLWTNVLKIDTKIEKRFGAPYFLQVSKDTLYSDLQKLLLKEMSGILHEDVLISAQSIHLFKIRVLGFNKEVNYINSEIDFPLISEAFEREEKFVILVLEWDPLAKSQIIADDSDALEVHSSVASVTKISPSDATSLSLQDCFSHYTSEEKLGQGDAYFCPDCNRKVEVVKKMGLWTLPDVLIIHLKRFKNSSCTTNKLTSLVSFPISGFDMSPNVSKGPGPKSSGQDRVIFHSSKLTSRGSLCPNYIYDLYAVCNHHGSDLMGGHYTAHCKNPTDSLWYNFDDVLTKQVEKEEDIITQDAYILFYQRRDSSKELRTSSSSGFPEHHWAYRMPNLAYKAKLASYSSRREKETFNRNAGKYATLPSNRSVKATKTQGKHCSDGEPENSESETDDDEFLSKIQKSSFKSVENERPIDKNDVD